MLYAFLLGKNTALSLAEIFSVLAREHFIFVSFSISGNALIIKLDKRIENPQDFLDRLGGTVKIAEIITETPEKEVKGPILGYISNSFSDSKFVFGISSYNTSFPRLGFEIKKELKDLVINSRFVRGKEKELSAPEIKNNKILTHGADFVLIKNIDKIFVGKTIAIFDYESYSFRDWNRPRRNAKSGMLPPKLAQIMLNLIPTYNPLGAYRLPLIFDPFCGQGTILQEALLMGYQAIGSDNSKERIYDAKENLKWLKKEYDLKIEVEKMVFQADALNLTEKNLPAKPDVIVSEVYLGPPLTGKESEKEIIQLTENLQQKYIQFIQNTYYLLPTTYYFVLALPFYKLKNKVYHLNIIDEIKSIGYNVIDPFDQTGIGFDLLPEYDKIRKTILYSRPDQMVGREIIILKK